MTDGHLLMDAGNTSLKLCFEDELAQQKIIVLFHGGYDINQELQRLHEQRAISRISLSCVYQPTFIQKVAEWCERQKIELVTVLSQGSFGQLINGYDEPAQLGVDRWLSMIAIWENLHQAFFVVSCGTAVTLDAVAADGRHLGGMIIPGPELMKQSLIANTAAINDLNGLISGKNKLATNTEDAVNLGTVTAVAALIEKVMAITGFKAEQGVLTGGCAGQIAQTLDMPLSVEPDLVLKGLSVYVKKAVK